MPGASVLVARTTHDRLSSSTPDHTGGAGIAPPICRTLHRPGSRRSPWSTTRLIARAGAFLSRQSASPRFPPDPGGPRRSRGGERSPSFTIRLHSEHRDHPVVPLAAVAFFVARYRFVDGTSRPMPLLQLREHRLAVRVAVVCRFRLPVPAGAQTASRGYRAYCPATVHADPGTRCVYAGRAVDGQHRWIPRFARRE